MNKNGWGLRVELVIIIVFLICLVIATIGLNRIGLLGENENSLLNQTEEKTNYNDLESRLTIATKKYFTEYLERNMESDELIIRSSTLYYNGYLSKLVDNSGSKCSGYTKIISSGDGIIYLPYIKCKEYKTSGYEAGNDW